MSYGHEIGLSNAGLREKWSNVRVVISKCDILGEFASWTVRQSPYVFPDGLTEAISKLDAYLSNEMELLAGDFYCNTMSLERLEDLISERVFHLIPEIAAWNERKNGNDSPFSFCSRYDQPEADDDFIDLGALARNVTFGVFRNALLDTDPEDRKPND